MKSLALLLSLICTSAFAQGASLVRGDSLKRREYQTYSTQTFFVDPTGNNTNACTGTGVDACATVTGVLNKLPRFIRNAITITVAAGTYVENISFDRFIQDSAANITFDGAALANFTPTTGTTTGTLTGVTGTTFGDITLTDSGQTLTTNDLKGRFIEFTSGPATGAQAVIVSNTGTTWRLAGNTGASLPVVGNTYRFATPATIIAPAAGNPLVMRLNNVTGNTTFNRFEFRSATGSAAVAMTSTTQNLTLISNRVINTSTGIGFQQNGRAQLLNTFVSSNTGTGLLVTPGPQSAVSLLSAFVTSANTSSTVLITVHGAVGWTLVSYTLENTSATGSVLRSPIGFVSLVNSGLGGNTTARFICAAGSTGTALSFQNQSVSVGAGSPFSGTFPMQNFVVENCGTGLDAKGGFRIGAVNSTFTSVTNAAVLARGAVFETDTFTPTGVTNDVTIDGTVYTSAFINTLTPKAVTNNITNSEFYLGP